MIKIGKFSRGDLFLRIKKISRVGVILIIIYLLISLIINLFGELGGISITSILIIAPLSGITQELYFRCSLQVVFEQHYSYRTANIIQSIFFIWWHLRLFLEHFHPLAWLGLVAGLGFFGLAWGFQSRKDGTILYVIILHVLGLMGQSLLIWNLSI